MKNRTLFVSVIAVAILLPVTACSRQNVVANNAVQALKKMQATTETGVNYQQYSQMLTEAQVAVNEANTKLPDGELKKELEKAMDAYKDAKWAWDVSRQAPTSNGASSFIVAAELQDMRSLSRENQTKARELFARYSLFSGKASNTDMLLISTDVLLDTIWKEAQKHVNRASELLR